MSTPLTDVQAASQLPPAQRLMLVQVQRGDDIDPRNGATRHALEEKGLLKQTTGWESLKLSDQGLEVAAACALATLNSLSKEARGILLDVANNRYDPQHRFRFHLSSASLAIVNDKAGTVTLTSLGICTAALAMMEETPAPTVEAAQPDAAPAIEEQPTETDPATIAKHLTAAQRDMLLDFVNGAMVFRGDPAHKELQDLNLITSDSKGYAFKSTLLGKQVAAVLMDSPVFGTPVVEAAPEPTAAPAIDEQPTPLVEAAQPPTAPVNLTPDDETMLMQVLYTRPIRPQNPKTRDRLAELGLLIVESEYRWILSITDAGRQVAEKFDILRGVSKFDLCKLWELLQGQLVHERMLSDRVRAFDLATFDESSDLDKRGLATLTEAGRAAAQRAPLYVATKLTSLYPGRGQALIDLIRGSSTRISEGLSKTLWDWGVIPTPNRDAKLTPFGRAVAVECAAILGQSIYVGTPPNESTPPAAPVVEAPAPEPAQQLAELASGVGYDLETAEEAVRTIIEIAQPDSDPAPVVEAVPAEDEPAAPIEEPQPQPDLGAIAESLSERAVANLFLLIAGVQGPVDENQEVYDELFQHQLITYYHSGGTHIKNVEVTLLGKQVAFILKNPDDEPAAPAPTDDRAALQAENERLRAALLEASEALGSKWMEAQDKKMVSKKIADMHRHTQSIIRSNSEAAARRTLQVEAENADLKRQLADLKKAQPAAPATINATGDDLRAELDVANEMVKVLSREKFQTQNLLVYMLQQLTRTADHLDTANRRADRAESDLKTIQKTAQRWQSEYQIAIAELSRLGDHLDRLNGSASDGHIILKDVTVAELNLLANQRRPLILTQFVGDALYIVAGPPAATQPQPEKPATGHIDGFDDMVAFEDADIINIDDAPAPDPVNEPVFVFDSGDTTDDPDGTQQMLKMMREGARPDATSRALDERNEAAARADFARRLPTNPPSSRSAPPSRPALTTGQ